ncbi:MAG: GNAT family N-acetyltransferase [Caldicoprobacterales bacterium]
MLPILLYMKGIGEGGIGGNLLKKVEEYALENGINQIELLVSKENKKSVEFYINRDFEIERYVMKKQLSYDGESK